ncbi:LmeA family phospholipid-binding protein [Streptomyces diastatochromogenes]|uniref:LmeA family phospholipid-binding protein n=1 Tax=Streptomyces diastatochromogenes TaxID=42236 RepID=UPI0036A33A84
MSQSSYATEPAYGDGSVYIGPPSPGRRRRIVIVAVASLAALVLTGVTADRFVAGRVESRTAKAFQDGMDTPNRPSVHVSGFPVLTQLASGTLRHVDITAHDIPAHGSTRPLPITRLTLGVDDLKTSGDADEAHARAVEATAFLSYEDLSDVLGLRLSRDSEPGRVRATVALPLGGRATVSTAVSAVSGNRIAFTDFRVAEGALPGPAKALLDRIFAAPIPLRNIPEGLHLRSLTPTASGVAARFTGRTVTFRPDASTA